MYQQQYLVVRQIRLRLTPEVAPMCIAMCNELVRDDYSVECGEKRLWLLLLALCCWLDAKCRLSRLRNPYTCMQIRLSALICNMSRPRWPCIHDPLMFGCFEICNTTPCIKRHVTRSRHTKSEPVTPLSPIPQYE